MSKHSAKHFICNSFHLPRNAQIFTAIISFADKEARPQKVQAFTWRHRAGGPAISRMSSSQQYMSMFPRLCPKPSSLIGTPWGPRANLSLIIPTSLSSAHISLLCSNPLYLTTIWMGPMSAMFKNKCIPVFPMPLSQRTGPPPTSLFKPEITASLQSISSFIPLIGSLSHFPLSSQPLPLSVLICSLPRLITIQHNSCNCLRLPETQLAKPLIWLSRHANPSWIHRLFFGQQPRRDSWPAIGYKRMTPVLERGAWGAWRHWLPVCTGVLRTTFSVEAPAPAPTKPMQFEDGPPCSPSLVPLLTLHCSLLASHPFLEQHFGACCSYGSECPSSHPFLGLLLLLQDSAWVPSFGMSWPVHASRWCSPITRPSCSVALGTLIHLPPTSPIDWLTIAPMPTTSPSLAQSRWEVFRDACWINIYG